MQKPAGRHVHLSVWSSLDLCRSLPRDRETRLSMSREKWSEMTLTLQRAGSMLLVTEDYAPALSRKLTTRLSRSVQAGRYLVLFCDRVKSNASEICTRLHLERPSCSSGSTDCR